MWKIQATESFFGRRETTYATLHWRTQRNEQAKLRWKNQEYEISHITQESTGNGTINFPWRFESKSNLIEI